ncbi:MAG TPA: GtrA family protein [Acidimicrobiales bacterium]|nr:GtrA family protein [Acidimicrobiales bacterium]
MSTTRSSLRSRLREFSHSPGFAKLCRYGTISVVSTVISLSGLFIFYRILSLSAGWSNIWATVIATIPYYYLNRMWVFKRRGRSHLTREVIPFWVIAFGSLILSTLAVRFAGHEARSIASKTTRAGILVMANFMTYGILWLLKFFVFNKLLFRSRVSEMPTDPPIMF